MQVKVSRKSDDSVVYHGTLSTLYEIKKILYAERVSESEESDDFQGFTDTSKVIIDFDPDDPSLDAEVVIYDYYVE